MIERAIGSKAFVAVLAVFVVPPRDGRPTLIVSTVLFCTVVTNVDYGLF